MQEKRNLHGLEKTLLILMFTFIIPFTSVAQFSGGSGTEGDPYIIATPEQLAQLAIFVNSGNADYNDKHYKINNDISLLNYQEGEGWTPIGGDYDGINSYFQGTFDGNNKKITELKINTNATFFVGLFGIIYNATVKNIGIENANIFVSKYFSDYFVTSAGVIAGIIVNSSILNCYATGTVSCCTSISASLAGGVAGRIMGSSSVSNCYTMTSISSTSTTDLYYAQAGGIAGECINGFISNCYSTGMISCSSGNNSFAGGLAGSLGGGKILNCYSTGMVSCSSDNNSCAGGVVGLLNIGTISNCAALNPAVICTGQNVGRVVGCKSSGNPCTLLGNIAFVGMESKSGMEFPDDEDTHDGLNGESKTKEELQVANGFPEGFTSEPWTYAESKLPGLFGKVEDMPEHLKVLGIYVKQTSLITIYPNPANNTILVEYDNFTKATIKLYDMLGKEVLNQNFISKTEINISHLPKGVYCVSILSENKMIENKKIIKQ